MVTGGIICKSIGPAHRYCWNCWACQRTQSKWLLIGHLQIQVQCMVEPFWGIALSIQVCIDQGELDLGWQEKQNFGRGNCRQVTCTFAEWQITEYAAAALGNLAAGSQPIKDALRDAGAIPPLVKLLRDDPEQISAELAAVVLRNLSLQNPANRQEIVVCCLALSQILKFLC